MCICVSLSVSLSLCRCAWEIQIQNSAVGLCVDFCEGGAWGRGGEVAGGRDLKVSGYPNLKLDCCSAGMEGDERGERERVERDGGR